MPRSAMGGLGGPNWNTEFSITSPLQMALVVVMELAPIRLTA